jgi:hypothetical protein
MEKEEKEKVRRRWRRRISQVRNNKMKEEAKEKGEEKEKGRRRKS